MNKQYTLEWQISNLNETSHLCLLYEKDPMEQMPALIPFIKQGLANHERFIYIADDLNVNELHLALKLNGINVEAEQQQGSLKIWTRKEWRKPGVLNSLEKAEQVKELINDARAKGFTGIRFAVEMTCALNPDIEPERLEHWEATLNTLFPPDFPCKMICQYNRQKFPASIINQAFRTHTEVILKNSICKSNFYQAPLILNESEEANSEWMISRLQESYQKNRERTAELLKSLREKDILIKEIHHRVKNNLQVISSLIRLQCSKLEDKNSRKELEECQERIKSMALVHEAFYRSKDFATMNLNEYISSLGMEILKSYNGNSEKVKIEVDVQDVKLDMDTSIACGLILNELITNSNKYAFTDNKVGEIKVNFTIFDRTARLIISDNGIGLPKDFDINNCKTLGLHLVKTLTSQLEGKLEIKNGSGTSFNIEFPLVKSVN